MIFPDEDREICKTMLKETRLCNDFRESTGSLIVEVGFRFLDAPYRAGTLEREGAEKLIVSLRVFDCVTFVETIVTLTGLIRKRKTGCREYAAALERIRYRGGRRNGYASRLHYFSDWLRDNARKGIVRDVTRELGGIPFRKRIFELTARRENLPPLRSVAEFGRMRIVEAACSRRTLHYIPKTNVEDIEKRVGHGDIIAVTTDADGIDVSHVGIAVRTRNRVHLLHASSKEGKVVLSDMPLSRYLFAQPVRTGIIVSRTL